MVNFLRNFAQSCSNSFHTISGRAVGEKWRIVSRNDEVIPQCVRNRGDDWKLRSMKAVRSSSFQREFTHPLVSQCSRFQVFRYQKQSLCDSNLPYFRVISHKMLFRVHSNQRRICIACTVRISQLLLSSYSKSNRRSSYNQK